MITAELDLRPLIQLPRDLPILLQFGVFVACGLRGAVRHGGVRLSLQHPLRLHDARPAPAPGGPLYHPVPGRTVLCPAAPPGGGPGLTAAAELPLSPQDSWGTCLGSLGIWLLVQSGTDLFFFSFAAFCAMFTGHILALPAFYGILNLLVYTLYTLIRQLFNDFFFGFSIRGGWGNELTQIFTPIWSLSEAVDWDPVQETVNGMTATTGDWHLLSPGTVAGYAVAGVVLAVLALLVYRKRQVESAGDVVSVRLVRPIFQYGVAFCSGLCLGMFTTAFFGWRNRLAPGGVRGRVGSCGLFCGPDAAEQVLPGVEVLEGSGRHALAVMALLCAACFADVMGITTWVPQTSEVASATVDYRINYPYDDGNSTLVNVTDPQKIEKVVALHQAIVENRDTVDSSSSSFRPGNEYTRLDVTYTLTDGSVVERSYMDIPIRVEDVETQGTVTWALSQSPRTGIWWRPCTTLTTMSSAAWWRPTSDYAATQSERTEIHTAEPLLPGGRLQRTAGGAVAGCAGRL